MYAIKPEKNALLITEYVLSVVVSYEAGKVVKISFTCSGVWPIGSRREASP